MTRVNKDRELREETTQLNGNLPLRHISIFIRPICGEATVDSPQTLNPHDIESLQGPNPQIDIGIYGIFEQDRDINATQRLRYILHGEGVCGCPCTDPEDIDPRLQRLLDMPTIRDLRCYHHSELILHPPEPREPRNTNPLETVWTGARFPYPGAENLNSILLQLSRRIHHLSLILRATWPRNYYGSLYILEYAPLFNG